MTAQPFIFRKTASILLGAGEGSRLFDGDRSRPKGTLLIQGKSLFERLISQSEGPIAILVSDHNAEATEQFLREHHFFGKQISLFLQRSLPVSGREEPAPAGNGDVFRAFYASSYFSEWQNRGIERIQVTPIDNPLAHPQHPLLNTEEELAVQVVKKLSPEEPLGEVVIENGSIRVKEYFEGNNQGGLGFTGLFSMSLSLWEKAAKHDPFVPYHEVVKWEKGKKIIKKEKFVFDFFPLSKSSVLVEIERGGHFFPIKTPASLEEIQRILE